MEKSSNRTMSTIWRPRWSRGKLIKYDCVSEREAAVANCKWLNHETGFLQRYGGRGGQVVKSSNTMMTGVRGDQSVKALIV